MTTLIDRILSQIIPAFVDYNLRTKKHIIEYWDTPETIQLAEDRLNIEKQLEYNLRQILEAELTAVKGVDELEAQLNQAQNNAEIWTAIWAIYDYLKQTPVNDSQPKEVEIKKIKNVYQDCPNCEQDNCLILNDMNYCPWCGSKIKWIA